MRCSKKEVNKILNHNRPIKNEHRALNIKKQLKYKEISLLLSHLRLLLVRKTTNCLKNVLITGRPTGQGSKSGLPHLPTASPTVKSMIHSPYQPCKCPWWPTTSTSEEPTISTGKANGANKALHGKSFENCQVLQKYENPITISSRLRDVTITIVLLSICTKIIIQWTYLA